MLIRSVAGAVLDRPQAGTERLSMLTGRAVPYDAPADVGFYVETIAPGCFRESLDRTANVPLLTYHDSTRHPIGVATSWQERRDGLHGTWRLDQSDTAQEAARLVRDGLLNFLSIRFQSEPEGERWTVGKDGRDHVRRMRARLVEVSLVSTPAYADATVTGVRALSPVAALAVELDAPLLVPAIQGTNEEQAATVGLVRSFLHEFGSRAPAELADLAIAAPNPATGLNLARAASALEDTDSQTLREVQLAGWTRYLQRAKRSAPESLPRRRRRR